MENWQIIKEGKKVKEYRDIINVGEQNARYIKVSITDYTDREIESESPWKNVSIYEIEVYGDKVLDGSTPEGLNLALNKVATASSQEENSQFLAAKAFDGIIDRKTTKSSRWASGTELNNQWLQVDLGDIYQFDNIVVEWEIRNPTNYRIQVSDDNKIWRDIYTKSVQPTELREVIGLDEKVSGRYVRLYIDEYTPTSDGITWNTVSIFEMEIYNGAVPEPPKTIEEVIEGLKIEELTSEDTVLKMPNVPDGFEISFVGADYEEVIDYDMNIHKPLVDTKVVVNF